MSGLVVAAAGVLIWRSAAHRVELAAVAIQLVGVLLGAQVALARLLPPTKQATNVGSRRLWIANRLRLLAARWRVLVLGGVLLLVTLSIGLLALGVQLRTLIFVKPVAWLVLLGFVLAVWGWGGCCTPTAAGSAPSLY